MTINVRLGATTNNGNCTAIATYNATFVVGNPPGGSVGVDYTWHMASGKQIDEGVVTMKQGTTKETITESLGRGTFKVFVSWIANGKAGQSASVPVTVQCIT